MKIKRYKLKDNITSEELHQILLDNGFKIGGTWINKEAYLYKNHYVTITITNEYISKRDKRKTTKLLFNYDIDIAFKKDLKDWNDFDNILVLEDDFLQPYYPFYDYMNGKYKDIQNAPNTMPYLIKEYNDFMDSLDFLEEIKEDINENN